MSELLKGLLAMMEQKESLRVRILYEEEFEDVVRNLAAVLRERSGLMTFRYQKALLELGHLLAPASGRPLLILLCSSEVILEIFKKVQEKVFDSHYVLWLVILDNAANLEQVIVGLKGNIDEGTQVILLAMEKEMRAKIFLTRPDPKEIISFRSLGTWDILSSRSMRLLPAMLLSDIRDQYADLKGREVIVGGNDNLPLMMRKKINPDGSVTPAFGMDIGTLDALSPILNYTSKRRCSRSVMALLRRSADPEFKSSSKTEPDIGCLYTLFLGGGATQGIYKQTWDLFHHEDLRESLVPTPSFGFDKVLQRKFVFIAPGAVSVAATTTRGREKFHLGRETFFPLRYGIAFHTGSPLKDKFSHL
ncbi:uncharacterized protein LOC135212391 [Macrobrachium nipponense]|uniref:uncharacterized protein LOC135212391 n=1 Tax=Macrobrachium nipponense TaxID=159736 RepID=UPI0030C7CFA5